MLRSSGFSMIGIDGGRSTNPETPHSDLIAREFTL
jgi:hypothetical protein